ncbi:MAG: glycosyl hydrolase family 18 protein, partial [Terriglobales bacterium]
MRLSAVCLGLALLTASASASPATRLAAPVWRPQQALPAALPLFASADIGQALFYAMPDAASASSFRAHASQIGVIAPQSFALTSRGELRGSLPADLAAIAQTATVPIMPLVINAGFSRRNAIRLLRSSSARDRAIGAMVEQARQLSLAGWQIDFEGLPSSQRAAFSRFVREVAEAMHRHGMLLSVAVAARTSDDPSSGNWKGFSGVYDYAALASSADFLSVMAYPESDATHPGPLASAPWVEQVIEHVLE